MTAPAASAAPKPRRSPNHERLLLAFVEHPRTEDAAHKAGCSPRTARRWKADPDNWAEVVNRRSEFLDDAVGRLRRALPRVTEKLLKVALEDEDAALALRAAVAVLNAYGSLTTSGEHEARLSALEQRLLPQRASRPTLLSEPYRPAASAA